MILITGASGGIGSYLFKRYREEHKTVFGTYLNTKPIKLTNLYSKVDITDYNQVKLWIENTILVPDKITLINCAGINYNSFAHKSDIDKWTNVININLLGTFNVIHALLPIMRIANYGRIINISSILVDNPVVGTSAYCTSKSALTGLAKSIAIENKDFDITINNINLGYSELGMIKDVPESMRPEKLYSGEEIFNMVEFLRRSSDISGESIKLNDK